MRSVRCDWYIHCYADGMVRSYLCCMSEWSDTGGVDDIYWLSLGYETMVVDGLGLTLLEVR